MKSSLLRWYIPGCVCTIFFINHYARDTVGALERQIEEDLHLSASDYSLLNSLFFVPNTIVPLLATILCIWLGGAAQVVLFGVTVASCGHVLFALGASLRAKHIMNLGRLISGSTYELIDCVPIAIIGPLFREEWGMLVGLVNGILRSGSVCSFVINPMIYMAYGVKAALWGSAMISVLGIFVGYGLIVAVQRHESQLLKEQLCGTMEVDAHTNTSKNIEMADYNPVHSHTAEGSGVDDVETEVVTCTDKIGHENQLDSNSEGGVCSDEVEFGLKEEGYSDSVSPLKHPYRVNLQVDQMLISMGCPYEYSESIRITFENTINSILEHFPFHEYGTTIYIYILGAVCLYGAMVPFWFIGSKFLQLNYNMTVGTADTYMMLPEGAMVVVSPLFGIYLDRTSHSLPAKINFLALTCIGLGLSYVLLSVGYFFIEDGPNTVWIPPLFSMTLLGVSYGLSNSTMWSCLIFVVIKDSHLLSVSSLMSCALNLLPAVMPMFIVLVDGVDYNTYANGGGESSYGLILMFAVALLAGVCFHAASRYSVLLSVGEVEEEKEMLISEKV